MRRELCKAVARLLRLVRTISEVEGWTALMEAIVEELGSSIAANALSTNVMLPAT